MKKNHNANRGTSAAVAQALASSPDFQTNLCLVLRDKAANEIFRSEPILNAVAAERIGEAGVEEFFELTVEPAEGVGYPGVKWDAQGFFWTPDCE